MGNVLSDKELKNINNYFNAANYLSVGQLYLLDNPLLERPLVKEDLKANIVGHFGTVPGQNFIYTHLNRVINKYDLNMIYISGPGHGGNALISNAYLEGTYSEIYKDITQDKEGLKKLFKQFSFPGGVSSHVSPEVPGSINEGGELGYSLSHAFGAVLDNPSLIAACIIGDGEAETGPLATSWHLNKFLNPKNDGVVLPILHLNGFKISNPTILSRISKEELDSLLRGYGWEPNYVEGNDIYEMHEKMAKTLDRVIKKIKLIKTDSNEKIRRPIWPMIVLRTPKGWTGPKKIDDKQIEGSFRSHQVPVVVNNENDKNIDILEKWLKSYHPEELFNKDGSIKEEIKKLSPKGEKRMSANKYTNGGKILNELKLPDFRKYEVDIISPGEDVKQDMIELGKYIKDVIRLNDNNFRIFGPDEALSNRLNYVFEITDRQWVNKTYQKDEFLSSSGRIIDSFLSEHFCEGALEGYLLTGRHGFIHTYEAFSRIIDSMVSQHAKWIKVSKELSFREDISSLNILLTSHIWQQDHNGYTHQDPGMLNHLVTKKADIVRMYLPFDTNTLLCTFDHILRTKNYVNVVIASKHPRQQWLNMEDAIKHCENGIGILDFATNDKGKEPDIVFACAGDTPTLEVLAATKILNEKLPKLKIRVINVVDLMKLVSNDKHPHGLSHLEYDKLFTKNKPIIFNFHGYPSLIHELTYNRTNQNMHVHGYIEEGTITTPFDMRVQNKIDRFNLVIDALKYLDKLEESKEIIKWCTNKLKEHHDYIREYGTDMDIIKNWKWID